MKIYTPDNPDHLLYTPKAGNSTYLHEPIQTAVPQVHARPSEDKSNAEETRGAIEVIPFGASLLESELSNGVPTTHQHTRVGGVRAR